MQALLITVLIILYSLQTLFCKLYSDKFKGRAELITPVFCILESAAIVIISLAFNGFRFNLSLPTIIIGVINAAVLFGYNTSLIAAGARGSYAFLNVAMLFGGIIAPMIYSAIFLNDGALGLLKYIAIAAMLISFILMNLEGLRPGSVHISYYLFCLLLFVCNGVYGTLIKVQEQIDKSQSKEMIILTYGIMGVIALIQLVSKEKSETWRAFRINKEALVFLILCIFTAGLAINVLVLVIPAFNAAVFFTVESGGVLLVSAIYSMVFFKEKPTIAKISGILLAAASITVLSI